MASVSKSNKNSATEDDVGLIHKLVTKVITKKLEKWLELIEEGGDVDLVVDMKQLKSAIDWCDKNGIVCADPAEQSNNELGDKLSEIRKAQHARGVVVPFKEDDEEGYGT